MRHWAQRERGKQSQKCREQGESGIEQELRQGFLPKDRKMEKKGERRRQFPEHEQGEGGRQLMH